MAENRNKRNGGSGAIKQLILHSPGNSASACFVLQRASSAVSSRSTAEDATRTRPLLRRGRWRRRRRRTCWSREGKGFGWKQEKTINIKDMSSTLKTNDEYIIERNVGTWWYSINQRKNCCCTFNYVFMICLRHFVSGDMVERLFPFLL